MSNQHQNFCATFYSRTLMAKGVSEEGVSVQEVVANQFGASCQRVRNWLARYERGGPAKLHPHKLAAHLAVDVR